MSCYMTFKKMMRGCYQREVVDLMAAFIYSSVKQKCKEYCEVYFLGLHLEVWSEIVCTVWDIINIVDKREQIATCD